MKIYVTVVAVMKLTRCSTSGAALQNNNFQNAKRSAHKELTFQLSVIIAVGVNSTNQHRIQIIMFRFRFASTEPCRNDQV